MHAYTHLPVQRLHAWWENTAELQSPTQDSTSRGMALFQTKQRQHFLFLAGFLMLKIKHHFVLSFMLGI